MGSNVEDVDEFHSSESELDGYDLAEYGEGLIDVREEEVEILDGEGNFNVKVQENAVLEEVMAELNSEEAVGSPSFEIDGEEVWAFPEEDHGSFNELNSFVDGEELVFELGEGEEGEFEMELPVSQVQEGSYGIEREVAEADEPYDLSISLDEEEVWSRSIEDELLGDLETWVQDDDLRSVDHRITEFEEEKMSFLSTGDLNGEFHIRDGDDGGILESVHPTDERIAEIEFLYDGLDEDDNLILNGLFIDSDGEIFEFTFTYEGEEDHELEVESVTETDAANEFLLTEYLTENEHPDVITRSDEEILFAENTGADGIGSFIPVTELPEQPLHVSITPEKEIITTIDNRPEEESYIDVFEFDVENEELVEVENYTMDFRVRMSYKIEFTGEDDLEFLFRDRAEGDFEVWEKDENDEGNLTKIYHQEIDHPVNHVSVGELTGTENGYHDFATVGHLDRDAYVYTNWGDGFEREFEFGLGEGGRKIHMQDVDGTEDLDLLILSSNYIRVARNRRNWTEERITGLAGPIQSYIDQADEEDIDYDAYDNPMITVPFTLHSEYGGTFTLKNPSVQYDYTPTIDITDQVNDYIQDQDPENDYIEVPAAITADDDVTFTVETTVTYEERGPLMHQPIPDTYPDNIYTIIGDHQPDLIDLTEYFYDPLDQQLQYDITTHTDLEAEVENDQASFHLDQPAYANHTVQITAENEDGRTTTSNEFTVHSLPPEPDLNFSDIDPLEVRVDRSTYIDLYDYANMEGRQLYTSHAETDHQDVTATAHDDGTVELLATEETTTTTTVELTAYEPTTDQTRHTEDTFTVEAVSPYVPIIDPIPEIQVERTEPLTQDNSVNLYDHTHPPEGQTMDDLTTTLEHDTPYTLNIDEQGYLTGSDWEQNHTYGSYNVTYTVDSTEPEEHTVQQTFSFTINRTAIAPTLLEEEYEQIIDRYDRRLTLEDMPVEIDLAEYFTHPDPEDLNFIASHEDITIEDDTALWTAEDTYLLEDVTFTAYERHYTDINATTPPITLDRSPLPPEFNETRFQEEIINEFHDETIPYGDDRLPLILDLANYFDHPDGAQNLTYQSNYPNDFIVDDTTATWDPEYNQTVTELTNLTFRAQDRTESTTTSPINLTMVPSPLYTLELEDKTIWIGETWEYDLRETFYYELGHVFSTDHEEPLEEGPVPNELHTAFEQHDHTLPETANLTENRDWMNYQDWMITDDETELYRLDTEDERIHVYRLGPEQLAFNSSHDEISIDDHTATWTPQEETTLEDVTFTAYDRDHEDRNATSAPITLEAQVPLPQFDNDSFRNDVPEKVELETGETWQIDLTEYFSHPLDRPLEFETSHDEITIDNNTASWNPQEETTLSNVTFTAYDPDGNSITSTPITLEAEEPPSELQQFLNSNEFRVAAIIILIGAVMLFLGIEIERRKAKKTEKKERAEKIQKA